LQQKLGNGDSKNTEGLSDQAISLVKSGKLTFSSLYSVMVSMESELQTQKSVNENLTRELYEVQVDVNKLFAAEAGIKELKSVLNASLQSMDKNKVSLEELGREIESVSVGCGVLVAKFEDAREATKQTMDPYEVKLCFIFYIFNVKPCSCQHAKFDTHKSPCI
jgi:hypothetical protein